MIRIAEIPAHGTCAPEVAAYLPANYKILSETEDTITIVGEDSCGWTLDDYVIPRLASGLIFASEVGSTTSWSVR